MDSIKAYECHARGFLNARDQSNVGAKVVDQWARSLHAGASVIELGCGGGYPITQSLQAAGLTLRAIDSSPTLIETFQTRFPEIPVQCASVQESSFFDRTYDGVVAVGLIFLLPEPDQLSLISRCAQLLLPGGRFLFTAPIEIGSWVDVNTAAPCLSLGQDAYKKQCEVSRLRCVATYTDGGKNNYYDMVRS